MALVVDEHHLGPDEDAWDRRVNAANLAPLEHLRARRIVIVAPHPDDEILGTAGLIQWALKERQLVEIIAVTDGESSHPASTSATATRMAEIRVKESMTALQRLGWKAPHVTRLNLPDGDLAHHQEILTKTLQRLLLPDDVCVAPWNRDGHPDHDVTGSAALAASKSVGARSLSYLIWAWHWARPDGADIPWKRCQRLELNRRARARKRWSIRSFQSQIRPLGLAEADAAILPSPLLRRFWRPYEVFIREDVHDL